jgi:CDGSH iron-sulfur domain-containing protein 3
MENLPKVASEKSIKVEVKAGQKYLWCSCGLSENQPFCDGKHKGTGFKPSVFVAEEDKIVGFCGCKQSKKGALCDGEHRSLKCQDDG